MHTHKHQRSIREALATCLVALDKLLTSTCHDTSQIINYYVIHSYLQKRLQLCFDLSLLSLRCFQRRGNYQFVFVLHIKLKYGCYPPMFLRIQVIFSLSYVVISLVILSMFITIINRVQAFWAGAECMDSFCI